MSSSLDLSKQWDFSDAVGSEARFLEKMKSASQDEVLILKTQVARTYGIRGQFEVALEILRELEPDIACASLEAKVRFYLESGRAICSPAHSLETQTHDVRERARPLYVSAFEIAKEARLDGLAVDALHMMAMVDIEPEKQLEWDLKALAYVEGSDQPEAKKWEASLRHNAGYALQLAGRYVEALSQFERALQLREIEGHSTNIRVGRFMIAKTMRLMGRLDGALTIQLELDQLSPPSIFSLQELEVLYRALGDESRANAYAKKVAEFGSESD
jgi:tetratricopeptide (TPR) repeat protein